MGPQLVSKGEFAAMINVSPGRVSQFIAAGQISAAAMVGSGQRAKINVERAKADLRLTLDVSQRLGNGASTNIDPGPAATAPISAPHVYDPEPILGIDHKIKQQKFEQLQRANRNAAVAEARDAGQLTDALSAKAEMVKIAASMLDVFDGGINDMAMAVAANFELPQRDVKHLMRTVFRDVRERAARVARERGAEMPDLASTTIETEETDQTAVT